MTETCKPTNDAVCVLFSGGSDSSLTAYKASKEFARVHLLTFRHFGHVGIENSKRSFEVLKKNKPKKFQHEIIDISNTFEKLYYRNYFRNLFRYKTLLLQFTCFACQAAFHIHAITYCRRNNVFHIRDGANSEYGDASPMQIEKVNTEITKLYAEYGIIHSSPIYYEYENNRSDQKLFELGLREQGDIKGDPKLYKKYQGYCKFMPASTIFLRYRTKCPGYPEDIQQAILAHWKGEVCFFMSLIDKYVEA